MASGGPCCFLCMLYVPSSSQLSIIRFKHRTPVFRSLGSFLFVRFTWALSRDSLASRVFFYLATMTRTFRTWTARLLRFIELDVEEVEAVHTALRDRDLEGLKVALSPLTPVERPTYRQLVGLTAFGDYFPKP